MTVSNKGCKKHVLFGSHSIVSVIFMAAVSIIQASLWPFCPLFKISVPSFKFNYEGIKKFAEPVFKWLSQQEDDQEVW